MTLHALLISGSSAPLNSLAKVAELGTRAALPRLPALAPST
jgi:hypothetical protein